MTVTAYWELVVRNAVVIDGSGEGRRVGDVGVSGQRIVKPTIVEEEDTTSLILPGWTVEIYSFGNLHIHRADDT